jgi:Glycosyl hydrolase family 26
MPLSRRALLAAVPLAAASGVIAAGAPAASAEPGPSPSPVGAKVTTGGWCSGVTDPDPDAFGTWRGTPCAIAGMFADSGAAAQLEQFQFVHSTFAADVDLAVGGPYTSTWAQVAAGADVAAWKQTAAVLRDNWHYRTVYLRYAHEFNGYWMKWSVPPAQLANFKKAFRLFATTMRTELKGLDVKIVFAPNFGTWPYTPDAAWPGSDVVDVVGVSMYEWTLYDTVAKFNKFASSSIGPNYWLAYARRHGRPLALGEWGARSPYFLRAMNAWMKAHAGTGAGGFLYDVYLNDNELLLSGALANQYKALHWGR